MVFKFPIFTADGTWDEALEAGSLLDGDVFPTGNFGSHAKENIEILKNLCIDIILKHLLCAWNFGMAGLTAGNKRLFVEIL